MSERVQKTDAEISTELRKLQTYSLLFKIIAIGGIISELLLFATGTNIVLAIACLAVCFLGLWLGKKNKEKIKTIAGACIFQQVLEEVFDDVEYRPLDHLSERTVDSADFHFGYDGIEGDDYVKATYKGMGIEMSDIGLYTEDYDPDSGYSKSYSFRGLWMVCDFGKELAADVRVMERSRLGKVLGKGGIKTENEAFNKQFNIRSKIEEEAFYILTPHMMEYIVKMDEEAKAKTNLSFLRSGKLHIALNTHKNSFEVKLGITEPAKIKEQFESEIRHVTNLIDELRLVDTMFKD